MKTQDMLMDVKITINGKLVSITAHHKVFNSSYTAAIRQHLTFFIHYRRTHPTFSPFVGIFNALEDQRKKLGPVITYHSNKQHLLPPHLPAK